ncbi:DUF6478 family protein [Ruegeria arenilitoris]|uniref:DUF6478 family protein n=1 Tax=Ruegeria arenilitoris TaxID=1173585 RepID=UPI001479A339|nr:DUF6478 family protein [Ruegeria arenilitoris]
MNRILDLYLYRRYLARWTRAGQQADRTPLPILRHQRDQARQLRARLDQLIQQADGRLVRPLVGSSRFSTPIGTDWSWRPDLWREPLDRHGLASIPRKARVDGHVTLFHDCPLAEIAFRQVRNRRDKDLAPFSLVLETFDFAGSFFSVSVEIPSEAAADLTKQHLIRLDTLVEQERPVQLVARLNIQHGPNTEHVLRELDTIDAASSIDFDLAHLEINERRIEKLWLDLIMERPPMNRIVLRDLTLCRHHRADL